MRLRFFFTPITTDEGGFLAIGRWWSHGAVPYRDVFVDRPQGLLLLYRLLVPLGLDRPNGVRLLALVFCLIGCAACGCAAARLSGGRSALFASLSVGVLASIPRLEGFIANGELLSGAVSALAVAVVLRALWERQSPHLGWLALAGVLAGCALTIKIGRAHV